MNEKRLKVKNYSFLEDEVAKELVEKAMISFNKEAVLKIESGEYIINDKINFKGYLKNVDKSIKGLDFLFK